MNYLNTIAFDKEAKEYVLITNGKCRLDHSSPEAYAQSHNGKECQYVPSEAIALRTLGLHHGKPIIGWTYRQVKMESLSCGNDMQHQKADFEAILAKRRSPYFIGRV